MMKELEYLFQAWNWIKDGSVQFQLSQENKMLGLQITPDTAIIDIMHPSAIDFISPFIKKNLQLRMHAMDHIESRGSILLGFLGAFKAKRTEMSGYLSILQEVATILADNKKCLILAEQGRQLAKLGHGADSLGMRLLNLKHIEVNDLSALMRLLGEAKLG